MSSEILKTADDEVTGTPRFLLEAPPPVDAFRAGRVPVLVYRDENEMGLASAIHLAIQQCRLAAEQGSVSMMLMAAPSAFAFYRAYIRLVECSTEIRAALRETHFFQFDDYRLPLHNAASFRYLLCNHFFFPLAKYYDAAKVHLFQAEAADIERACREYGERIMELGPDLQLKGTGENGHWGFHEPGIPLDTEARFQRVQLSEENVAQQMRDHPLLFPTPESVPTEAYSANVPLFLRTKVLIEDNVPQASKAFALLAAHGSDVVDAAVPSSAMKQHPCAILRTTSAASWALRRYRTEGVVSASMLDRLAADSGGAAVDSGKQQALRRKMQGVLERMRIPCEQR